MVSEVNLRLAEESVQAYNDHDLDRGVTFWADPENGLVRQEYQKNMWLPAFPDTHMQVTHMFAQGAYVVTEAVVRATHTGTLKMWVTKPVPATGKRIEFPYCSIGRWENGKLQELHVYVNECLILKQLGITENIDWSIYG